MPRRVGKRLSVQDILDALPQLTPLERDQICSVFLNDADSLARRCMDVVTHARKEQDALRREAVDQVNKEWLALLEAAGANHRTTEKKLSRKNEARANQVRQLRDEGWTDRAISLQLKTSLDNVRKFRQRHKIP